MNNDKRVVVIVPCSGIGKSLGTVSRETAYELCENLRPHDTQLVALSKLVLGDEQARQKVRTNAAVTIDGCKQMCAAKLVKHNGGTVAREIAVFEEFRHHKDLRPEGIAELNAEGMQLSRVLAEEIAEQIGPILLARSRRRRTTCLSCPSGK
jgi:uncharacterized metal-binding protein